MRDLAIWTMIAIAVVTAVVDGYLLLHAGPGASISGRIRELSRDYPAIPFAAGCLVAHWFGF